MKGSQHPDFGEMSTGRSVGCEEANRSERHWFRKIPVRYPRSHLVCHGRIGPVGKGMRQQLGEQENHAVCPRAVAVALYPARVLEHGQAGAYGLLHGEGYVYFLSQAQPGGGFSESIGAWEVEDVVEDAGDAFEVEPLVFFCEDVRMSQRGGRWDAYRPSLHFVAESRPQLERSRRRDSDRRWRV